jgi:hypothetical protein
MENFSELKKFFKDLENQKPPKLKKHIPMKGDAPLQKDRISWIYTSDRTLEKSTLHNIKKEAFNGKLEHNPR